MVLCHKQIPWDCDLIEGIIPKVVLKVDMEKHIYIQLAMSERIDAFVCRQAASEFSRKVNATLKNPLH